MVPPVQIAMGYTVGIDVPTDGVTAGVDTGSNNSDSTGKA